MTDKKQRAPRQMTVEAITKQIHNLQLTDKISVFTDLKARIETEKKAMQEQIELITASVK